MIIRSSAAPAYDVCFISRISFSIFALTALHNFFNEMSKRARDITDSISHPFACKFQMGSLMPVQGNLELWQF